MNQEIATFRLGEYEVGAVESLIIFVESLIRPRGMPGPTIQGLARALHALGRLPLPTEGVNVVVTVSNRFNQELSYHDLTINETEFELGTGGSVYDPNVGSDSYSRDVFSASQYSCEGSSDDIYNWLEGAKQILSFGGSVSVEDFNEDDGIDWDMPEEDE